ncbi:MAG: ribosome-binding factor A [Desulfobacteraceae bacterium 4572_87]|nr:MAG: ribosome-binding factor A [Desulfobacteraceae bacterium 4572_87]
MLPGKRSVRVGDVILKEVAFLLLEKVRDPRVQGVTLTGVRLSDDLKLARIFYSVMGDQARVENAQSGLNSATGYVKREIGRRAGLRYIPEIKFVYDPSLKTGEHMERVFEDMRQREEE